MITRPPFLLVALLFVCVPGARGQTVIKEADLVGTWHSTSSNAAATEITYSADHHYTFTIAGIATGSMTGPWRTEGDQVVRKWTGGAVTVLGKKQEADGSEQREKLIKLENNTLTTQERGEDQPSKWQRGPLSK